MNLTLTPGWHPIAVHFAVALLTVATALLSASPFFVRPELTRAAALTGSWNLYGGAIAALTSSLTGLAAAFSSTCRSDVALHAVSLHFRWALLATLLFSLSAIGRLAQQANEAVPSRVLRVLLGLAFLCLCVTGYLGGQNVFVYGMGVVGVCAQSGP